ncbi:hypothetical protein HD553DRAFT_130805 [Filobasidium floriforme]|uniref:uncharacterized protein n=1 Tax=Filobasidium floriforme TaxID=5210 RepID=UPI001E8EC592|nr:uncharacterized protein HD553DRAFT_130805 [Filobasidium floriforme]KAH8079710.1 hypothetical protein HD553DRAFT_130805 [Filobasidium floriforme]
MPAVHKKGALFAVHQDSPGPASTSHSSSTTGVRGRSAFGPKSGTAPGLGLGLGLGQGRDENVTTGAGVKNVNSSVAGAKRNVLGNKSNLGAAPAGVQDGKKEVKPFGVRVVPTQGQGKENPREGGAEKAKSSSANADATAGLGLGVGTKTVENRTTATSTTTSMSSSSHAHRRGKSGDQSKTIKSRLFGTSSASTSHTTANNHNNNNSAQTRPATWSAQASRTALRETAGKPPSTSSSLISGLRNTPVRQLLLGGRAGSSRSNALAGRAGSSSTSTSSAQTSSASLPVPAPVPVDDEEDEIYSRPVTRKQKKVAQPPRPAAGLGLGEDVFLPAPTENSTKAPRLAYTSTFAPALQDMDPLENSPTQDLGGFALPAFPAPLTGGLFGPNKVVSAETRVKGLFGRGKGKENVPPVGERVIESVQAPVSETRTHRSLGSAFTFEPIVEVPDAPLTVPVSPSPMKRRPFGRSDSQEDGLPTTGSIHGLGFGFTPCRASPIASTSASRRHQREASSASGINHFLPHSHSAGSGLGDNSESSFEKAKVTPLKQRSKKRASDKKTGGHRRGASSMSLTNHFLPTSTSSDLLGRSIETSPMARAKVTPLKSRRKHVRQKSSLSRGFSFGSNHVGLGFDMSAVDAPTESIEYGDEQLGDMESTPSVWESASSKRSSNTTSSLGSTSKRFWGLDVQAEDDEGEGADGFLTGSPISRRKSGSPSRMSLFVPPAELPESTHGWIQTQPGEFQAPPPPPPRRKGKGKLFLR